MLRQTPGRKGVWGNWRFVINEQIESADAWVVYENLLNPTTIKVPSSQTVLVTAEPPAIHGYSRKFTDQFAAVVTCHNKIHHPNKILRQQGQPWHLGVQRMNGNRVSWDFDQLSQASSVEKQPLVSILVSNKRHTPLHRRRLRFAEKLVEKLGDRVRLFGRGFQEIDDKYTALAPYQYAVVLENEILSNYLTEKLTDALLARCLPIYVGCPNAGQYLPHNSFIPIGLGNLNQSVEQVRSIVQSDCYAAHVSAIEVARKRVLNELNVFDVMANVLDGMVGVGPARALTLVPQKKNAMMRLKSMFFNV